MSQVGANRVRAAFAVLAGVSLLAACGQEEQAAEPAAQDPSVRLEARPSSGARACAPGEYELRLAPSRRALLRVAPGGRSRTRPLLVALHGAGSGGAPGGLWAFRGAWTLPGLMILAPAAAGTTWTLGPTDVRFVERALQAALERCRVDPLRIAIGGFSAGAGMALWLGLANGDLFRAVIALSGGASLPDERVGKPKVYVAHGTRDEVIPIAYGGDEAARRLREDGYVVTYRRFEGGHRVLPAIARESVRRTLYRR
jgi:predicted esterase